MRSRTRVGLPCVESLVVLDHVNNVGPITWRILPDCVLVSTTKFPSRPCQPTLIRSD